MGADVAGIGRRQTWPCVGDPDGEWFACAAVGEVSLLALVPAGSVAEPTAGAYEDEPVLVHMTACREHSLKCRRWLRERMHPQDEVDTYGTEYLMTQWGQVQQAAGTTPILRMQSA